jgi:DNA (cytosine-5)-methyltransferase 1
MDDPLPTLATHSQMALATGTFVECRAVDISCDSGEFRGTMSPFLVGAGGGEYAGKPRTADDAINTITCHSRQAVIMPSLIRVNHGDVDRNGKRRGRSNHDLMEPLPTQSTSNEFALVTPQLKPVDRMIGVATMVTTGYGEREGQAPRCLDIQQPTGTFVAGGAKHAVVEAGMMLTDMSAACTIRTDMHKSNAVCAYPAQEPFNALTTTDGFGIVRAAFVTNNNTNRLATSAEEPIPAMTTGNQQIVTEVGLSAVRDDVAVHIGQNNFDHAGQSAGDPMTTMTQTPQQVIVQSRLATDPFRVGFMAQNNADKVGHPMVEPVSTMTTSVSHQSVVEGQMQPTNDSQSASTAVFMAQHNAVNVGHPVTEPVSTMTTAVCHQGVVASHIMTLRQNADGQSMDEPLAAFCAAGNHHAEVRTCLVRYYGPGANDGEGTISVPVESLGLTEEQRFEAWWIARFLEVYGTKDQGNPATAHLDGPRPSAIGRPGAILWTVEMRMLVPKEAFSASSFPKDYKFEHMSDGRRTTKTQQMALVGNAVPPGLACAIIKANFKPRPSIAEKMRRMAA